MSIYHFYHGKDENKGLELKQQRQNISSFIKAQFSAENLVFFIGSGCSVPAIPLMSDTMHNIITRHDDILCVIKKFLNTKDVNYLIDKLDDKEPSLDDKKPSKEKIAKLCKDNNLKTIAELYNFINQSQLSNREQLLKTFEDFYSSFSDIESLLNWIQNGLSFNPDNEKLSNVYQNLKKEFMDSIPKANSDLYKKEVFQTYSDFYKFVFSKRTEESSKISIFTTNYDLFNEYSLEANNIAYTTGFPSTLAKRFDVNQFRYRLVDDTNRYKDKWQPVFKEANLYKIHGSINWVSRDDGFLYQSDSTEEGDVVVIYPTMLKHKETAQAPYSELFREFSNCLQKKNTTLFVMGYGFPYEHINTIISQNLKNQDFNLIIFGDKDEDKLNNFYEEFKNRDLHLIGGQFDNNKQAHHFKVISEEFLNYQKQFLDDVGRNRNE